MIYHAQRPNGLEVIVKEVPHLPIVSVMLTYKVGSAQESPSQEGLAHFLEHMMFKSTQRYAAGEIDSLTQCAGGSNNAYTWLDSTAYYVNLAADRWPVALEIEAERMQNLNLLDEEIELEKQVVLEEWRSTRDDAEEVLWEALHQHVLGKTHPYSHPVLGSDAHIKGFQREDFLHFYQEHYHPGNAALVVVGDIKTDEVLKHIAALFDPIPGGKTPQTPILPAPVQEPQHLCLERQDIAQRTLYITTPAPNVHSKDAYPLKLLQYLLTDGQSAHLIHELVDQEKILTNIDSLFYFTQHSYLFWSILELKPETTPEQAKERFYAALKKLQSSLSEPDLQKARQLALAEFAFQNERIASQNEFLSEMCLFGLPLDTASHIQKIEAVTLEDIQNCLTRYFFEQTQHTGLLEPSDKPMEKTPEEAAAPKTKPPQAPSAFQFQMEGNNTLFLPQIRSENHVLENGLEIKLHPNPKSETLCLGLWVPGGSFVDPPGKDGLATLFGDLLLRGSSEYSARELHSQIESKGASAQWDTSSMGWSFQMDLLSRDFETLLPLMPHMLWKAQFPASEIELQRDYLISELKENLLDSTYRAADRLVQHLYQDFPYGRPSDGSLESLNLLSRSDLLALHSQLSPQGAILCLSGNFEPQSALNTLKTVFSEWTGTRKLYTQAKLPPQPTPIYEEIYLPDKSQCVIQAAHRGIDRNHPDYAGLFLLDTLLGSGANLNARLPFRLREQEGLAYSVQAAITRTASHYPGLFLVEIETPRSKVEQALRSLKEELERAHTTPFSESDVQLAKTYLSGQIPFAFESNAQITHYLIQKSRYNWSDNHLQEQLEAIMRTTPDELLHLAQKHLDPKQLSILIAGNTKG